MYCLEEIIFVFGNPSQLERPACVIMSAKRSLERTKTRVYVRRYVGEAEVLMPRKWQCKVGNSAHTPNPALLSGCRRGNTSLNSDGASRPATFQKCSATCMHLLLLDQPPPKSSCLASRTNARRRIYVASNAKGFYDTHCRYLIAFIER